MADLADLAAGAPAGGRGRPARHAREQRGRRSSPSGARAPTGYELTLAVNYLSHFLLTELLLPRLREPARIVNVASIGQAPLDFDDPMFERDYDGYGAYAQSKLAQVAVHVELAERLAGARSP